MAAVEDPLVDPMPARTLPCAPLDSGRRPGRRLSSAPVACRSPSSQVRMPMRTIVAALLTAVLCAAPLAARAAEPVADAPKIPHMSREEARAYVQKADLALTGSN